MALRLLAAGASLPLAAARVGSCPSDFVPVRDLGADRTACTAACGDSGYCCTTDSGGCQNPTCTAGCYFAWHSASEEECLRECEAAKGTCSYNHPSTGKEFAWCRGHEDCGCPATPSSPGNNWGPSNDCGGSGCEEACRLATNLPNHSFYGRPLTQAELDYWEAQNSAGEAQLVAALDALRTHLLGGEAVGAAEGTAALDAAALAAHASTVEAQALLLRSKTELITTALDLVELYEVTGHGPMFATGGDFERNGQGDLRDTDRAMHTVQQVLIDHVFNGGVVAGCSASLFDGRGWKTADYYPGAALPPADLSVVHHVAIDAFVPASWGVRVAFLGGDRHGDGYARKPTGLYLSPGQLATISVPSAMAGSGYKVLVGAQTNDNSNKGTHKRMDRVTATFDIGAATTVVANPLGGGIYILVPYLANLGPVTVQISGGVIPAPLFQRTNFRTMSNEDWLAVRTAPAPWADFETDKFLLNVPSSWIFAYDDPTSLMRDYDLAMDGVAEWLGYPIEKRDRGVHMLYLQPDLHIRHGAYGIGYPQVNTLYSATTTYNGNHNHWLIQDPTGWAVCYHELGHAQLMSMYRGETEALNNYMLTYIRHVKFCDTFGEAFDAAQGHTNYKPDDAAVHWMITPNFREGKEMDHSNTEHDEFRYQDRGFGKYADITRLFGWEAFTAFYNEENLQAEAGTSPSDGLSAADSRTLRLSKWAGADVRPLIQFWGIFPEDNAALQAQMNSSSLGLSPSIRCLLLRYKDLIPADNAAFNVFFEKIHPGRPSGGNPLYALGWYNAWKDTFDVSHGQAAKDRVDVVVNAYYGSAASGQSCAGVSAGEDDPVRPSSFSWQGSIWTCESSAAPPAPAPQPPASTWTTTWTTTAPPPTPAPTPAPTPMPLSSTTTELAFVGQSRGWSVAFALGICVAQVRGVTTL